MAMTDLLLALAFVLFTGGTYLVFFSRVGLIERYLRRVEVAHRGPASTAVHKQSAGENVATRDVQDQRAADPRFESTELHASVPRQSGLQ